jgi:hypothetical protein
MPAGGVITITVTPKAIPAAPDASKLVNDGFGDTLTINSGITGDSPYTVQLYQTPAGAIVTFSTKSITFPLTKVGSTNTTGGNITVGVQGDVALSFQMNSSSNEFFVAPGSMLLQPNATNAATVEFQPKSLGLSHKGTISVTITSVIPGTTTTTPTCGVALPTIAVSGSAL